MDKMNNRIIRGGKNAGRTGLRSASALFGLLTVLCVLLPFSYFSFDRFGISFSGVQLLLYNIRINSDYLLEIPIAMRVCMVASILLVVVGVILIFLKKNVLSVTAFFLGFVCNLAEMPFVSEITKSASQAGFSTVSGEMKTGWMLFLLFSLVSAALTLSLTGVEKAAELIFKLSACISIGAVAIITVYMFVYGSPAIIEIGPLNFLFGTSWKPTADDPSFGILYMILASVLGCLGAIVIGVPIGLMTSVFLAEIAPRWVQKIVGPAIELLAGIPSVIFGFWGMKVLVPFIRETFTKLGYKTTGAGLLAVIIILAIMILPTIISVAETSLKSVPPSYTEASLALGNTKISTIFAVQIPAARSGILAGVILGVGRAIGETMAVIMVAGNIVQLPSLFSSVRPMTAGIAFEMGYAEAGLHRQALFGIGLVLFVFIMLVNITFTFISKRGVQMNAK